MAVMSTEEFAERINKLVRTGKMMRVLTQVAAESATTMHREARLRTTGGNPLNVRSGALRNSIKFKTEAKANSVTAEVRAGGRRAFYASVHEYGKVIRAKNPGGYLRFKIGNKFITTRSVTIPKRPFLAPARKVAIRNLDATLIKRTRAALRTVGIGG